MPLIMLGCGAALWVLWRIRNEACFRHKKISDPTEIIYQICAWIDKWLILQKEKQKEMVVQGSKSKSLRRVAKEAFGRTLGWVPWIRRLEG